MRLDSRLWKQLNILLFQIPAISLFQTRCHNYSFLLQVMVEPGRSLVATAGGLLTSVLGRSGIAGSFSQNTLANCDVIVHHRWSGLNSKLMSPRKCNGGQQFTVVDASMTDLIRCCPPLINASTGSCSPLIIAPHLSLPPTYHCAPLIIALHW